MPHCGTSLLSDLFSQHQKVNIVSEPFQSRGGQGLQYHETRFSQLAADAGVHLDPQGIFGIAETTRRAENGFDLFELMRRAQHDGVHVVCCVVIGCPFKAYLNAIDDENERLFTDITKESFQRFGQYISGLSIACKYAGLFTLRFTTVRALTQQTDTEMPRLFASFGWGTPIYDNPDLTVNEPQPAGDVESRIMDLKQRFGASKTMSMYTKVSRLAEESMTGDDDAMHESLSHILSNH